MTVSANAQHVENSQEPAVGGVNSNQIEPGVPVPTGTQAGTGSVASFVADSLLTVTLYGNGPPGGITIGDAQAPPVSAAVMTTVVDPSAPRVSRAVRVTGKIPALRNVCATVAGPAGRGTACAVSGKNQVPVAESPGSGSVTVPEKVIVVPRERFEVGPGAVMVATGWELPMGGTWSSQTPRPWVATRNIDPSTSRARSWT